jgi:hypothetical protein
MKKIKLDNRRPGPDALESHTHYDFSYSSTLNQVPRGAFGDKPWNAFYPKPVQSRTPYRIV